VHSRTLTACSVRSPAPPPVFEMQLSSPHAVWRPRVSVLTHEPPRRRFMGCFFPSKKQIEHDGKLPAPRPVVHATPAPAPAPVMQNNDAAGECSLRASLTPLPTNDTPLSSAHLCSRCDHTFKGYTVLTFRQAHVHCRE